MSVHLESSTSSRALLFQQQGANDAILKLTEEIWDRRKPIPERALAILKSRVKSLTAKEYPGSKYLKKQLSEAFRAARLADVPQSTGTLIELTTPKAVVSTKESPEEVKEPGC